MNDRGLIGSLFDFSFSHFVTPKLQRFLYIAFLVISGLASVFLVFRVFVFADGLLAKVGAILLGLPLGGLVFLVLAMYFRVFSELVVVAFRGVEYLRDIQSATVAGSTKPRSGAE